MTFDEMYPPPLPRFYQPYTHYMVLKTDTVRPCSQCSRETAWVELNFECHLCSPECVDQLWREFFDALEASPRVTSSLFDVEGMISNGPNRR